MKVSLLRERCSVAIISFILLSSLIGKPVFALPGDPVPTSSACTSPPQGVLASNNGPLTCNFTRSTLTGTSTTAGTTYTWAGTGSVASFTASGPSVTVTTPGTYILTATNPATGCATTTSTTVVQTLTVPTGVTASHIGALTCTNYNVPLSGSSTTALTDAYAWTGPNGFTAQGTSATASAPGVYTITATYTPTGCTASASTTVSRIFTAPGNVTAVASSSLNCSNSSVTLTGSSNNPGAVYTWTGPDGFSASGTMVTATEVGTYTMTAANGSSSLGCTGTTTVTVVQDLAVPSGVTATASGNGQLTCSNSSVVLTGSSSTAGVTYAWAGPNGFTASGDSATVTGIGNYTVTVTNPNNGCSTSVTAPTVTQNTIVPSAVNATVNDRLTCNTTSVKITGSSTTTGVTYAWTGPGGFTSNLKETFVSIGGDYTVTATDPSNGCSFSRQITVQADQVHPGGVTISSDGSLSCSAGSVTLTGGSSTSGVGYTWTGPNGFFDPEQIISVVDSGTYVLTVNSPSNGCNTTASIVVTADFTGCSAVIRKATNGHAVTLDASNGSSTGVSGFTYKVYPNPASSTAVVELNAPASDHVSVEVYNGVGVREKILFNGNVEAGAPYRWTLDAGSLSAGVHYCMIRTQNKVYVSKLLIAR